MDELKKCPFCGSRVDIDGVDKFWIECLCGLANTSNTKDRDKLIKRWNTREPDPAKDDKIKYLKEKTLYLLEKIEKEYNFTCEAGPLSKCQDFIDFKKNYLSYVLDEL